MEGNKRNLNCFYSIFTKKRNSHGHFKCIKKAKIIPKSCCSSAIMLLSPNLFLFISIILNLKIGPKIGLNLKKRVGFGCTYVVISMILSLNCFYSIFAKKRNSHGHFKCIKKHKITPRSCCLSAIMLLSIFFMLTSTNIFHCDIWPNFNFVSFFFR